MVKIRPDEISTILRQQIEDYTQQVDVTNVGTVFGTGVRLHVGGLPFTI